MASAASEDLVEELVHQFSDPYAFYRELIQNSIDAGSSRIEVTLSYRPARDSGLAIACVQDWGEGMNRRIIDDYLLTKFRSSKENDLTKIGKYGIGFVSLFALTPDAVAVDTGRDGESWRVLFKKDRTYELLRSSEPFEGTRITLHKRMDADAFDVFVQKSREAVQRWCRHSEVDVAFAAGASDGRAPGTPAAVREEVKVDAPYQVEHQEEGLRVVVGPSRTLPATTGFYNRGLTLLETQEPLIEGVAVKIVSRTLEHTLTRDNVLRNEAYVRAVSAARKLADWPLREALSEELRKAAEHADTKDDWRVLWRFARERLPLSKLWLRAPGGGARPAAEVKKALVVSPKPTPVALRLLAAGTAVVECDENEAFLAELKVALKPDLVLRCDLHFSYAEPPTVAQPAAFIAALAELLTGAGCPVEGVAVAELRGAGQEDPWIFADALGRPASRHTAQAPLKRRRKHPLLCLNRMHPLLEGSMPLLERAPRLAALVVARVLLVRSGLLDEKTDAFLTGWALS
jgi:molecular chaperone HtpG